MAAKLWLQVEVVGCPTVCRHCWAQGSPYPAMPVADVVRGAAATSACAHDCRILRPLADRIRQQSPFHGDAWANLEARTEAAWAARALVGDWPTWVRHDGQVLELVCRPDLDLHVGAAGWYRERLGNLRDDGVEAVLGAALAGGGQAAEALWFGPDPLPRVAELAARYGDRSGQGVHFSADSVRYLWLDRAQPIDPDRRTRPPRACTSPATN